MIESVIGIDPGKKSAIAVVSIGIRPQLLFCAKAPLSTQHPAREYILAAVQFLPKLVVVENQYVAVNPRAAISLAQSAGRWIEAAEGCNLVAQCVAASTWQSNLLPGCHTRDERKAGAAQLVQRLFKMSVSADEADAICIALWGATTENQRKCHGT